VIGHAADRDEHDIGLDGFRRPAGRGLDACLQRLALGIDAVTFEPSLKVMPCFCRMRWNCFATSPSMPGRMRSRNSTTCTSAPRRRHTEPKLEPDHARADDQQLARHLVERKRAGGRNHALLVDLDAFEARHVGAGGDHDVLGFDRSVLLGDFDLAGTNDLSGALDGIDLVLLEQEIDALDVAVDAFLLEGLHLHEIELRLRDADAHAGEIVSGFFEQVRRVQQRLRGNAADVEAGAAESFVLLDHRSLKAELRRANGADIAAGPEPMTTRS
jgi:hypothetical protein